MISFEGFLVDPYKLYTVMPVSSSIYVSKCSPACILARTPCSGENNPTKLVFSLNMSIDDLKLPSIPVGLVINPILLFLKTLLNSSTLSIPKIVLFFIIYVLLYLLIYFFHINFF